MQCLYLLFVVIVCRSVDSFGLDVDACLAEYGLNMAVFLNFLPWCTECSLFLLFLNAKLLSSAP